MAEKGTIKIRYSDYVYEKMQAPRIGITSPDMGTGWDRNKRKWRNTKQPTWWSQQSNCGSPVTKSGDVFHQN